MCLAIPMKLLKIDGDTGNAELGGVVKEISLALIEGVNLGDYVLVHAGYAIQQIDEEDAKETIALLDKYGIKD